MIMDGLSKFSWQDIKQNFYKTGELPASIEKSSPIIQAWEQSKQAGLSPFFKVTALHEFPLSYLSLEDQNLADLTETVLGDVWQLFGQQDVSVYLINNHSKIIAEKHNACLGEKYHFLQPGRIIELSTFGAIAPTCSVRSKQPMVMVGHQHYLNEFADYSCASVPVFNGCGDVLGALNVTSTRGLVATNWLRHLLYQSYVLENKIILSTIKKNQRILHFQHSKDLLQNAYAGLIVIDEFGRILKVNQMALKLLNCTVESLLNQDISDFFISEHFFEHPKEDSFFIQSQDHAFFYAYLESLVKKIPSTSKQISTSTDIDKAFKALQADIPVLITGETGTGKDYFAQKLHQKLNSNLPFISINCGAIPENLLEAELFGYEGGAFTSAKKQGEKGLVELADQGILFLDEIGDLPLHLQVKILRVLQDQHFYRVGGRKPIKSSFRLICATNQNLKEMMEQQLFRSDLYYRIRGFEVALEPLRLRADKQSILHSILTSLDVSDWTSQVEQQFNQYAWPGNIRELIHVLKLSTAFKEGICLEQLCLPEDQASLPPLNESNILRQANLETVTKQLIIQVLQEEKGNIARTAKRLKISRTTVYKYLDS